MHYAIVTETWPPEVNGVALTVQALADGLRARGHALSIVRPRRFAGEVAAADETLVPGMPLPRYPGLRFGLPAGRRLQAPWRRARPDAIYIATEGPLGWSALRAARRLGIATATGFHTRFDRYMRDYGVGLLEPLVLRGMRRFHNRADATLVPTRELRDDLAAHGFGNVRQLARAVDTTAFSPRHRDPALREAWGVGERGVAVIHVGRIAAEKNLRLAVRSFRALQQLQPDARFVLVGDGPERERLALENPDFHFCGVQRGEALARHFASADLFVFPSTSETFGNVTLEALASGVPTVAFGYGAAREHLRHGVDGAAVATGDEAGFIRACARIGSEPLMRAAMARSAPGAVAGLQPARVAADFDAILAQLHEQRRTHGTIAIA